MADIDLTTTTTIPSGTGAGITATVHEDTNQDGTSDASASVVLSGGTDETNTLSGFTGGTGNDYWVVFDPINELDDASDAPTITEWTVDTAPSGDGGGETDQAGSVRQTIANAVVETDSGVTLTE